MPSLAELLGFVRPEDPWNTALNASNNSLSLPFNPFPPQNPQQPTSLVPSDITPTPAPSSDLPSPSGGILGSLFTAPSIERPAAGSLDCISHVATGPTAAEFSRGSFLNP